jgi:hypothetical protein
VKKKKKKKKKKGQEKNVADARVISGFCHEVDENCTLQGYYAVSSGNCLTTFREP